MCPGSASLGAASVFCTIATCLGSARPEASGMAGTASSARSGCSPSGTSALCVSNTKLTPSPSPWPASPRGARLFFLRLMASRATSQHVIFKARPCASTWVERSQGTDRTGRRQGGAPGPSARAGRDGPGARQVSADCAHCSQRPGGLGCSPAPPANKVCEFSAPRPIVPST